MIRVIPLVEALLVCLFICVQKNMNDFWKNMYNNDMVHGQDRPDLNKEMTKIEKIENAYKSDV